MVEAGSGQVLIVTSATGNKPALAAPIYSATRAAANMLIRSTALSIAKTGVTLNAIGTNYLDYPNFRAAPEPTTQRSELLSKSRFRWGG